jgi:hypothetical protein
MRPREELRRWGSAMDAVPTHTEGHVGLDRVAHRAADWKEGGARVEGLMARGSRRRSGTGVDGGATVEGDRGIEEWEGVL